MAKPDATLLEILSQAADDMVEQSAMFKEEIGDAQALDKAWMLAKVQEIRRYLTRAENVLIQLD